MIQELKTPKFELTVSIEMLSDGQYLTTLRKKTNAMNDAVAFICLSVQDIEKKLRDSVDKYVLWFDYICDLSAKVQLSGDQLDHVYLDDKSSVLYDCRDGHRIAKMSKSYEYNTSVPPRQTTHAFISRIVTQLSAVSA